MANENYKRYLDMLRQEGYEPEEFPVQEDLLLKQIEDQSELVPQPEYQPDVSLFDRVSKQTQNAVRAGNVSASPNNVSSIPSKPVPESLSKEMSGNDIPPSETAPAITPATTPSLYSEDLSDEAIKDAQKFRQEGRVLSLAARAGDLIGRGISGAKSDPEFARTMDAVEAAHAGKAADIFERRKGKEEETRREKLLLELSDDKAMSDSNSAVSIAAREQMTKMFPEYTVPANVSAKQLRDLGFNMGSLLSVKENIESRKDVAKANAEERKLRREEMAGAKKVEQDYKSTEKFNTALSKLEKEKFESGSNIQTALGLADEATRSPTAATNLARAMIKAVEGAGARVSDKDVVTALKSGGVSAQAVAALKDAATGTIPTFQAKDVKNMLSVMKRYHEDQFKKREDQMVYRQSKLTNTPEEKIRESSFLPDKTKNMDERIRVKAPNGQVGSIPKSQLDKAIKQGYTQVE